MNELRAPFPWFGGKSRVADLVWERFGNVRTYVEPFYGSGAVLLRRQLELGRLGIEWAPGGTIETISDRDCYVANFWRAIAGAPDLVAEHADWPVNEADLHARHGWLVAQSEFRERMMDATDPEYFDAKVAGWWVWGLSCWIGSGWCCYDGSTRAQGKKRPDLQRNGQGLGVHSLKKMGLRLDGSTQRRRPRAKADSGDGVHRQIPGAHALGGKGVHGHRVSQKMPDVYYRGGKGVAGQEVTKKKRPHLSDTGGGIGTHSTDRRNNLLPWFQALRDRLRPVRVVCGDFERVTGKSVVLPDHGHAGLFFDPPYPSNADRHEEIYSVDCGEVAHRAHAVALEWGKHERVRVAFCGYEGSHTFPEDWTEVAWKAAGGYGGGKTGRGEENRHRERIYFSPACLEPSQQLTLV